MADVVKCYVCDAVIELDESDHKFAAPFGAPKDIEWMCADCAQREYEADMASAQRALASE